MSATSTYPKNLLHRTSAPTGGDAEGLQDHSELMDELLDAFDDITIKAPERLTAHAMAYSASHAMHHSELLGEKIPMFLN